MGPDVRLARAEAERGRGGALLGKWGLISGTAGTLFGGLLADWLRRRYETGRVIVVALGLLIGGPLALWLLTIRDPDLFQAVFALAFFCLSWYNGPMTAVIFDVVPAADQRDGGRRVPAVHSPGRRRHCAAAGRELSDRFGLDRAVLLLPAVVVDQFGGTWADWMRGRERWGRGARTAGRRDMQLGDGSPASERSASPAFSACSGTPAPSAPRTSPPSAPGSSDRIASAAQCFRWLCSSDRLTPRSASCTDDDLHQHVGAVALLLDHLLQAAHLALDPAEPGEHRALDLGIHGDGVRAVAGPGAGAGSDGVAHDAPLGVKRRSRRLLETTLTELTAIAAAAMAGVSRRPKRGIQHARPRSGMPITL